MGNHEFFQTAPQLLHQAKELIDLGSRANLLQTLTDLGHPYGLLLGQSSESSESLLSFSFPPEKGIAKANIKDVGPVAILSFLANSSSAPSLSFGLSSQEGLLPFWLTSLLNMSAVNSSEAVFSSFTGNDNQTRRLTLSEKKSLPFALSSYSATDKDNQMISFGLGLALTFISKGPIIISAQKDADVARKLHWENVFHQQAFLAPLFLKLLSGESSHERSRDLQVGKNSVSLGTTAIKLVTFKGEQPFVVRTPQGEPIAQINPGDKLGHLHVSHQAALMRGLSPLEKAEQITQDFVDLFRTIDGPPNSSLGVKQQEVLGKAQNSTLIGISHLVRLFRRKTGLPTWKLDVLPELVQRFSST